MKYIDIKEIEGFRIGNAEDKVGGTGCTTIICEKGAVAGVDVRGGGPATRETDLLKSENMVQEIHSVVLSGGSAYGLEAASGVMNYLEEKGIGFNVGVGVVPIVCGASLFDLIAGDSKVRPTREMGYKSAQNAFLCNFEKGNHGAGTGATIGKYLGIDTAMKSGIGVKAAEIGNIKAGAIVAVNALGDIYDKGKLIAGLYDKDTKKLLNTEEVMINKALEDRHVFSGNTTISCFLTNVKLTKAQCNKLASILHDAYARSIKPVHSSADGDTVFVMSTCTVEGSFDSIGVIGARILEEAIVDGVKSAKTDYGFIAVEDI
ncbi:MAG: P1 family peptidase [Peptostreptococcaceae bacterium]|nr:P1 family peptidase [Peptostreptococcaceae bacterium]